MRATAVEVSDQITRVIAGLTVFGVALVLTFAWWAASRIDAQSLEQQRRFVAVGLSELADRIAVDQDSSAVWDEAVINAKSGNEAWLAENLVEWMSEYHGHDRVYVVDDQNQVVRSAWEGDQVSNALFEDDRPALDGLIDDLRKQMASASAGEPDSTATVTGLGVLDKVVLPGGEVAIASIRPIVPSSAVVSQPPGTEYLHISLQLLDDEVSTAIGEKFAIASLHFDKFEGHGTAAAPVVDASGRILGYFDWQPAQPALTLLRDMGPAILAAIIIACTVVVFLTRRLKKTSELLEVSEENASYLAFHDPLTGLPNRALFADRLTQALANSRRSGVRFALHAIDLDRFKLVNDTLGHPSGDELIRQVGTRLGALVRDGDTAARVGGDEFAIIQIDVAETDGALALGHRVVTELQQPFDIRGQEALVGASVGIAMSDDSGGDAEDLLRQADIALYEAKASGKGRYQIFAGELDLAVKQKRELEMELRAALNGVSGLELVYQPIYSADRRDIVGAEALVRWHSPTHGRLSPAQFIPLAEERGMIDQLGMWVLRQACQFALASPVPWVAVNVSPLQFRTEGFSERVLNVLGEIGLPPRRLEIEITEGLLLQNSPQVQDTLNRLRASGIRVALDDFGTGYSSISYLRTHGVDKLKIDQSFVAKLGRDTEIDDIVRCIIGLGNAMHMQVTAEGVETEAQAATLTRMGCGQLQGYLLSRPVTPVALNETLTSRLALSAS
jgi:diguanylate cyclase (GGDEF)-like protein